MTVPLDPNAFQIIPRLRYGAVSYPGNVAKLIDFCRRIDTSWVMVFEADDFETNLFALSFWQTRFADLARIVAELQEARIGVMLNMQVTFGHGGVANTHEACGFRMCAFPDGSLAPSAPCVLDEGFRAWAVEKYTLAARAGFDVVFIDDDFRQANQGRRFGGCFCPVHLDALAGETGRTFCAREVEDICNTARRDGEAQRIFEAWQRLKREGLASLGREIVQAVRATLPGAHMAFMIPGISSTMFSNMDLPALVGSICTEDPVVIRPPDGGYTGYDLEGSRVFGAFHSAHVTGLVAPDAASTPDTDNMTRTRFAKPASSYVFEGLRHVGAGIKIFSPAIMESTPTDWDDDPACKEALVAARPKLARLAQLVETPLWKEERPYLGVHFPLSMGQDLSNPEIMRSWDAYVAGVTAIMRLGFYLSPSPRPPRIAMAGAQAVKCGFVDEILRNPATAVLLDAEAAWELCRMGLDHLIGCRVEPETGHYAREVLSDHEANGRYGGSVIQCRNRVEREHVFRIAAADDATVLSEMRDLDDRPLGAGVTLFEGDAGRVAVFPFSFAAMRGWVLARRRVQLDWIMSWLARCKPAVFIDGSPDIVSLVHQADDHTDV